jgi:cellulose biosynthesis protein BcsQ
MESSAPNSEKPLILVLSTKPRRREELLEDWAKAGPEGLRLVKSFDFDTFVAKDFKDARSALQIGLPSENSGPNRPHRYLLVGGELGYVLRKGEIEKLVENSMARSELIVMGLVDTDEERRKLDALGVRWIIRRGSPPSEHTGQFMASFEELKRVRAAVNRDLFAAERPVELVINSRLGLLERGVITVHAVKGGVGKTSTAANIAYGLSLGGKSVILLDLNGDSAHIDRLFHGWIYRGRNHYESREELFNQRGLSYLSAHVSHQNASQKISPDVIAASIVPLIDAKNQRLDILPGVFDQTQYFQAAMKNLLTKKEWLKELIEALTATRNGWDYVVIDTGTAHYTSFTPQAINNADLFILVVKANSKLDIEADSQNFKQMLYQDESNSASPIHLNANSMVVANMIMPPNVPLAPRLSDIAREFEFMEPKAVVPVALDPYSVLTAENEGMPVLAVKESLIPTIRTPMRADYQNLVNTISHVYGPDGQAANAKPNKRFGVF